MSTLLGVLSRDDISLESSLVIITVTKTHSQTLIWSSGNVSLENRSQGNISLPSSAKNSKIFSTALFKIVKINNIKSTTINLNDL